jgi:hypothetical protein
VTAEEIQRVANQYVRPDEAAVIVVGDGSAILDQISPYTNDIEIYNTSGKRKDLSRPSAPVDVKGTWKIEVDTPLGQSIPAELTITSDSCVYSARITSEMGNAEIGEIEVRDNSFAKSASIDMDGHSIEIEVHAQFEGDQVEGTLTMQNASMPFTGSKTA